MASRELTLLSVGLGSCASWCVFQGRPSELDSRTTRRMLATASKAMATAPPPNEQAARGGAGGQMPGPGKRRPKGVPALPSVIVNDKLLQQVLALPSLVFVARLLCLAVGGWPLASFLVGLGGGLSRVVCVGGLSRGFVVIHAVVRGVGFEHRDPIMMMCDTDMQNVLCLSQLTNQLTPRNPFYVSDKK